MEICYYWTERLGYNKHNKGFNFGSELNFSYDYENKKLIIEEDNLYIKNFFNIYNDEQISNITAVVGRNGVGKSKFLEEIKSLYVQGGILAKKDKDGNVYDDKRIFVIKNKKKYEIVYHKDLLLKEKKDFVNYELDYQKYGNNLKSIFENKDLFVMKNHSYLEETYCIYFSYAFDNNFYTQTSSTSSKYFDLSTKGILNEINYELESKERYPDMDPKVPNYINIKDNRFNIGFLREYYVRENKKRIHLLNSEVGRGFITKHKFFPTKAYLNLDYILRRQDNFLNGNTFKSLLRSEKRRANNVLENEIYDFIEKIYDSRNDWDNKIALAQQTYLRRILDSYFEDVHNFINYDAARKSFKKELGRSKRTKKKSRKSFSPNSLKSNIDNLCRLMDTFNEKATMFLKEFSTNNEKEFADFDDEEFTAMTESYKNFITHFNNNILTNNSAVSIREGTTYLNPIKFREDSDEVEGAVRTSFGIVEIDLTTEGLSLLDEFLPIYNSIVSGNDFIKIDWEGLSTGEDALLGMFSRFFELGILFNYGDPAKESNKRIVILLDEIEHSLHPEWQRRILSNLIEFLPLVFTTAATIQVILATNVPFIVADIPTSNIIYLEKNKGLTQVVDKPNQTFAANIHSLLMSNFFMDTTIGKFSEEKIKAIVNHLKVNKESDDNNSKIYKNLWYYHFITDKIGKEYEKKAKKYSQEEIRKTIEIIGEPVIRTKLKAMYDEKYPIENRDSSAEQFMWKIESDTAIPEDIKGLLKEKFRELNKEQKDDKN
ncbi:hypothetical protein O0Q50_23800 [Priestia aryabhattai]|uniref:Endonuclease GajA/Old nuclease/RecF-like AAA domain-containing protein n=1 Tax=Priestia aryabhattai TaxID=412384 RepID=A0AAX6NFE5_PRIAR|nr:hypothetical protein [Priestia aryabhattai]MDU9694214.1 hypothetical protein [Priestia aryabhattai]